MFPTPKYRTQTSARRENKGWAWRLSMSLLGLWMMVFSLVSTPSASLAQVTASSIDPDPCPNYGAGSENWVNAGTLTWNAGDTLSFEWKFDTKEDNPSWNDSGGFRLINAIAQTQLSQVSDVLPAQTSGWQVYTSTLAGGSSGDFDVYAVNEIDCYVESTLTVRNVQIIPAGNAPVADDESFTVAEGGSADETDLDAGSTLLDGDTDADLPNDTLTVNTTPVSGPSYGLLTLYSDGTFDYTHNGTEDFSDSFTYEVSDEAANTDTAVVAITITPVNDNTPVANADSGTVAEGGTLNEAAPGVLGNDTDADMPGDTLTAALATDVSHGNLTLNADGSYTYIHNGSENLSDSFTYTVFDGVNTSAPATVTLTITPVNDNAPVVNNQSFSIDENSANGTSVGTVVASDADVPAQTLTFTETGGTGAGAFDISAAGEITVADSSFLDYETTTSFTLDVQVDDNGTPNLSDTATMTINLNDIEYTLTIELAGTTIDSVADASDCTVSATDGNPSGMAGGTGSSFPVTYTYEDYDTVDLTATDTYPDTAGSIFKGWSGDASGTGDTVTITMDGSKTATAIFNKTYSITPSEGTGGDISPDTVQIIEHGDSTMFTMTADSTTDYNGDSVVPDYTIVEDVLVDGGSVGAQTAPNCPAVGSVTYTFTNVKADHTIEGVFTDFGNDCSTAIEVCCMAGQAIEHVTMGAEINPVGDIDYFKIVTHEVGTLKVYTTGYTDTYGYLYKGCPGALEGENDNRSASDLNFYITRQFFPAGTYYVAVKHWEYDVNDPIGTGPYIFHVEFNSDDHGNDPDHATPLACDASDTGEIETGGDVDYFEVSVNGDGLITAYTTGTTDTYGQLTKKTLVGVDEVEVILSQDNNSGDGNNFYIERTVSESAYPVNYYIAVSHSDSVSGTGAYTLFVDCSTTHTITASADYGGSISPSGDIVVAEGRTPTFAITPDGVNTIDGVEVDGTRVTLAADNTYTFPAVLANHVIVAYFNKNPDVCVDISDIPMDARFSAAAANIMFGMDDSKSMDTEIVTTELDGYFQPQGSGTAYKYVFDDAGDNLYSHVIPSGKRGLWKSQWSGYNFMYYDPSEEYEPWPTLSNADRNIPRSHPMRSGYTLNLSGTYETIGSGSGSSLVVVDNEDATQFSKTPEVASIVIDDEESGYSQTGPSGGWKNTSGGTSYNGDYDYTSKTGDYTVMWTPTITAGGSYTVYAMWEASSDRPDNLVTYTITHSGGTDTVAVDQENPLFGGRWIPLGTYTFDVGTSGNVSVTFTCTNKDTDQLCADAVKFEPVSAAWDWATSAQAYDGHYWWTAYDGIAYEATWRPDAASINNEIYEILARWDASNERSTSVTYTITHAGGTMAVIVNQRQNGGTWYSLGSYTLSGDGTDQVTLTHTRSSSTDTACADAVRFVPAGGGGIDIKNAHYYVWSNTESKPYLVIVDGGAITYYAVNDIDADDDVEDGELILNATPPADVVTGRTYAEERQNFANYYSFYRKRYLTTIYAMAKVVTNMEGVHIGFYSFNENLVQPVLRLGVKGVDQTSTLLSTLYNFILKQGNTPTRQTLQNIGRYFDVDDGYDGNIGPSPYWDEADGGGCQQAFTIIMTDGYYNGNSPGLDNEDGDGDTAFDGGNYEDAYASTLADVAMYYYENDLASSLSNLVPTNLRDSATHQHMVTYGVSFGVVGTLDPDAYDYVTTFPTWTDPTGGGNDAEKIDDLLHAAVNGRGEFINAQSPFDLVDAMLAIMDNILSRIGSASSVAINGTQLYETMGENTRMYQAFYNSDGWSGDLKAYGFNLDTGFVDTSSPFWSAADEVDGQNWETGRIIATHDGTSGIPFRYDSLTAEMKALLDNDPDILNYVRGDRSNELVNGGSFRNRLRVLGDIVASSPVYADGVMYVGGNDGMLHAFNASTGAELFAYVPSFVFENLKELKEVAYSHKFFVDLTPTVKKIEDGGQDKRILVGGLGKGGRGYFALNITDPSGIATESDLVDNVLWEYPGSTGDDDMGYTYSYPVIINSHAGWVVIFGNGYNSVNGGAKLFVLDAMTGSVVRVIDTQASAHCNGLSSPSVIDMDYDGKADYVFAGDLQGNLWKFDLTDASSANWDVAYYDGATPKPVFRAMSPEGTAQPITVKPAVMWACEGHGFMVTFGTGKWLGSFDQEAGRTETIYGIWDYGDDGDNTEYLGEFASDRMNTTNPLSNQPPGVTLLKQSVVPCSGGSCDGDFFVVGDETLRILTDAIADVVDPWLTTSLGGGGDCGDGDRLIACDPNNTPSAGAHPDPLNLAGWYFDLPLAGERVVSNPLIREGRIIYIAFTPEQATPCEAGGNSVLMQMDACSGGRTEDPLFDIDGDDIINEDDLIALGSEEVSVTGKQKSGRLQTPAIVIREDGETEVMIMSSSGTDDEGGEGDDDLDEEVTVSADIGLSYWIEFE